MDEFDARDAASRHRILSVRSLCVGRRVLLLSKGDVPHADWLAEVAIEWIHLTPPPVTVRYPAARFDVVICDGLAVSWVREARRVLAADGVLIATADPAKEAALRDELAFRFMHFLLARQSRFSGDIILPERANGFGSVNTPDGMEVAVGCEVGAVLCLASDVPLPPFGPQLLAIPEGVPRAVVDELQAQVTELQARLSEQLTQDSERQRQLADGAAQLRALKAREAALIARIARQQLRQRQPITRPSMAERVQASWQRLGVLYPNVFGRLKRQKPRALPPPAASLPVIRTTEDLVATMALAARLRLPQAAAPDVSVIIPTFGQVEVTLRCLESIAAHPPAAGIEVLVAEDASGDNRVELLSRIPGLRLLNNPTNLGFLRNCNAAARQARGEALLFLNNDTELRPGAIDAMLATLRGYKQTGMVGAKLLFADGRLQEAGGIVWNDASAWNWGRGEDPDGSAYTYPREVDYCSGAAILLRRDLFAELGGFDENFAPAYYEDTDLAFRIRQRGLKVVYEPDAEIVHHEGVSHGIDTSSGVKAYQTINQQRFQQRWRDELVSRHYPNATQILRARDRAQGRQIILLVDHYPPEPDRDAGSRVIDGVIQTLREQGWVVKFRPQDCAPASPYADRLRRQGIEIISGPHADFVAWIARFGAEIDHVMLSRPHIAAKYLPDIIRHAPQAALSYFGHDLHHARERREAALRGDAELHAQADQTEEVERRIWASVDGAIYLSEEEASVVRASSPGAVAAAVSPYRILDFPRRDAPPPGLEILFVAGFAHPPNVDAAHWLVGEILPLVRQALPQARLTLAGSNPTQAVRALAGPAVEVTGSISDAELAACYARARVAVVPLRFGAGVKGKVAEALSFGLPLVTTPTGAQGLPELADICRVVSTSADMAASLITLLTDASAWCKMSAAQTAYAQTMFSAENMRRTLLQALAEVADQARRSGRAGPA